MLKWFKKKNTLYCFTPEVMLATFIIEFALAAYVFVRHRMTSFGRLAGIILVMLGLFQIAEYQVCLEWNSMIWARIGIVAITLLPVLGLHLILTAGGSTRVMKFLYAGVGAIILYFVFSPIAVTGATCGGNYVIFQSENFFYGFYAVYYFGLLFFGIGQAYRQAVRTEASEKTQKFVLYWIIAGYVSFMLPMGTVLVLYDTTLRGVASIMCGFAVIFALILALIIVPLYHRKL